MKIQVQILISVMIDWTVICKVMKIKNSARVNEFSICNC